MHRIIFAPQQRSDVIVGLPMGYQIVKQEIGFAKPNF